MTEPEDTPTEDTAQSGVSDSEETPDTFAGVDSDTPTAGDADVDNGPGGRDVVVPLRLYKTVTVFSTLIAVVSILGGFVLLDRATQRASAAPEDVNLALVVVALALIVAGSGVYAFSTRFRTETMGKSKDDTDENSNNG